MRRFVVGLAVVMLAALAPAPATAAPAAAAKPPSKAQLDAAQKRANQAAARLSKAQTALAKAQKEIADLESRSATTQHTVDSLGTQVRQMAVAQYVSGSQVDTWIGGSDPSSAARGRAMLRFVSLGRTDAVAGFRVARDDLAETQAALAQRLAEQRKVVANLRKEEAKVAAELKTLAAAQKAYEARLAAAKRASSTRRSSRSDLPAGTILGSGNWICPVQGPHAFSNDYGDPRSGGRHHQGNDIMAPRGTPAVAPVAGSARGHNSSLGGISYYLVGDDGNTYFGTHLDRLSGNDGRVQAGEVLGYVGTTGNAPENAPHLHFAVFKLRDPSRYWDGTAVNPYPVWAGG